jgi:hypothetical protein
MHAGCGSVSWMKLIIPNLCEGLGTCMRLQAAEGGRSCSLRRIITPCWHSCACSLRRIRASVACSLTLFQLLLVLLPPPPAERGYAGGALLGLRLPVVTAAALFRCCRPCRSVSKGAALSRPCCTAACGRASPLFGRPPSSM